MTSLIAIVADLHTNSTIGLCKPTVILDDGGTYRASKGQRVLWANWLDYWERIDGIKADRKVGILNGDLVEGDAKKRSNQIITRNRSTILSMAVDVLEPALDVLDAIYIIRGTEAHTGKSAQLEEMLAQDLDLTIPNGGTASWWTLEAVCEGVRIFAAHHTSMGRLPWTFANAANRNALEAELYYTRLGKLPPDVAFYAHNHLFANSGRGNYPTQVFHLPAWQLGTAYANRKPLAMADIGGMTLLCDNGEYHWDKIIYKPSVTQLWKHKI